MKQWFLGGFLAAVLIMIWGFVFWATPISSGVVKTGASEGILGPALSQSLPGDGVYVLPSMGEPYDEEAWRQAHRAGPLAMVFYRSEGSDPMAPGIYLKGFLHMLLSALLIGLLLKSVASSLPGYGQRVGFVLLAALTVGVWANLGKPIWFMHPWHFYLYTLLYDMVAWLLAGLVLARFIRPNS